jgi:hypothetical protein
MFPQMAILLASPDPDLVAEMTALLRSRSARVYVAGSENEVRRLEDEGVVVDPWFWPKEAAAGAG